MSQSYDLLVFHSQTEPKSSNRFFGLSVMLHVALIVASFFVVVPAMEDLKKEMITIELQAAEPIVIPPPMKSLEIPKGEIVDSTRGAKQVLAPAPSAKIDAETAEVVAAPVQKIKTSHSKVAKMKTHVSGGEAKAAKSAVSRAGIPETLEDIPAPELDTDTVVVAQVGRLGDNEFESEFKNVDRSNQAAIAAEKSQLDSEAQLIADEKEAALQALDEENKAQAKAMEDALAETRSKNAAIAAQIKATEKAAAEKAAKDEEAARLSAAAAAAKSQEAALAAGHGDGPSGEDKVSGVKSGIPNGIRSLDQLKQIPGNPKPQYSMQERRDRNQGQVIFYAYVTSEGSPTQFRLVQSTGYRSLDGKTLATLKKWKFYPGQAGWVELPFKWDITGGVQEMPTLLRRVGSR